MGILDLAKKAVKFIPGVGPIADTVLDVMDVAGGIGKGRAEGRKAEADVNMQRDRLATDQYGIQQRSMLDAAQGMANQNLNDAQLGLTAPSMRAKQAVLGDALKNFQYKVPTHARANVVDFGSPFNLSGDTRALGGLLSSGALADQQKGNSPLEKVDYLSMLMDSPGQTDLPQESWLDKTLNIAGKVGSLGRAARGPRDQQTTAGQYATGSVPKVRFGNG